MTTNKMWHCANTILWDYEWKNWLNNKNKYSINSKKPHRKSRINQKTDLKDRQNPVRNRNRIHKSDWAQILNQIHNPNQVHRASQNNRHHDETWSSNKSTITSAIRTTITMTISLCTQPNTPSSVNLNLCRRRHGDHFELPKNQENGP